MTIEFTKEESAALLQLLDIATKAGGLNVAEAAIHLAKKFQQAEPVATEEATDGI